MENYRTRQERAAYLQANFAPFLKGRVLDVGCGEAYLRGLIGQKHYVGVDLHGAPDVRVDMEQAALPFGDDSFECVVCLDVLEHLEHIHQILGEIIRVTHTYVIVSLPNPLGQCWPRLVRGCGGYDKYGLPVDPPLDRHRWFFNYEEAKAFLITMAHRNDTRILHLLPVALVEESVFWKALAKWVIKRLIAPTGERHLNLSTQAIWAVLEKRVCQLPSSA